MDASEVLATIERAAPREGLPIIGPKKGAILDGVIRQHRPSTAVEVGTLVGYSAIRIARLLPQGGTLTCVELDPDMATIARANLRKAGLSERVEVMAGDAKEVLRKLQGPVDFVLVDAKKDEYMDYIRAFEPLLRAGSVVVADNVRVFADQVAEYLDYVRNSGKYSSSNIEAPLNSDGSVTDAMEISVKL
ncbi:MAG TPA: class I SAM-dependent methyltransferase [Nitrososphaerales archaeon]|nr:class I SAM-dependent methyltransferase [Nitrososphaerales archaeon]